eukprot:3314217-Rhodomonas_salina.2
MITGPGHRDNLKLSSKTRQPRPPQAQAGASSWSPGGLPVGGSRGCCRYHWHDTEYNLKSGSAGLRLSQTVRLARGNTASLSALALSNSGWQRRA